MGGALTASWLTVHVGHPTQTSMQRGCLQEKYISKKDTTEHSPLNQLTAFTVYYLRGFKLKRELGIKAF